MKKSLLLLILLVLVSTGIITAQQVDSVHVKKTVQTLETIDFKLSYFDGLKREVLPLYFMKQEEASYESIQLFDSWGRCVFFLLIEEESIELKIAEIRGSLTLEGKIKPCWDFLIRLFYFYSGHRLHISL